MGTMQDIFKVKMIVLRVEKSGASILNLQASSIANSHRVIAFEWLLK
jgi:hypothetical protein